MVEAPRLVASYDDAIELIPKTPDGILVTDVLSRGVHDRLPASASRLDAGLVATAPMFYDPAERRLSDVVEDLEAGEAAPWCTADMRQVCLKDALDQAVRLQQARPDSCQARALEARALAATGDVTKGMAKLAAATSEVSDHIECLKALAALARRSHLDGAADDALDKIAAASCEDEPECAQRLTWVGREFEAAGRPLRAISLYKKALELEPDERLLEHVATLAAAHGLHGEAAADFERLGVAHPEQEEWRVRAAEERAAAMREAATL
jgi:tetratricopeptide (TPR) repeat protein